MPVYFLVQKTVDMDANKLYSLFMTATQTNPYQEAARFRKVMLLSDLAKQHSISSSDLALMQDSHWAMLSQAARVNTPGAETRQAVIAALLRFESVPKPSRVFPL